MPRESYPFVKIRYFDRQGVDRAIHRFAKELKARPEVERVIVFGSFVRGESVPGSDIDILLVLTESNVPFLERIPKYMPSQFPVGIDIFPYTNEEIERMISQGNFFLKRALAEGVEIRC